MNEMILMKFLLVPAHLLKKCPKGAKSKTAIVLDGFK